MNPLISICVPAYKNTSYLKVLLDSISRQSFRDFEVIVTDDSPNDDVEKLCAAYSGEFSVRYFKNNPVKGSPANWNEAIKLAGGSWIKLMHDDDWFASDQSLQVYADTIRQHPEADFIFSAFNDYENGWFKKLNILQDATVNRIAKNPLSLFRSNDVGNPSVVLLRNHSGFLYDEKLKWVVDFEFYMRCIRDMKLFYIRDVLVNVGYNSDQITKEVFRNVRVEIPENIYMLNKLGLSVLKDLFVFDYYWRLFRNLNIRQVEVVNENLFGNELPEPVLRMLRFQLRFPLGLLRIGIVSKLLMFVAYVRFRLSF